MRRPWDASQGVVGRDAVTQVEVASEPVAAIEGEFVDRGEGVGPGEDTADGDKEDVDQGVFASALDAGIREIPEVVSKGGRSVVGHWVLLSEGDRGLTRPIPCTDGAFANLLEFASLMREPYPGNGYPRPDVPLRGDQAKLR